MSRITATRRKLNDVDAKLDLAFELFDRGTDEDLARLMEMLPGLPPDDTREIRGFLAWAEKDDVTAVRELGLYARQIAREVAPFTSEGLLLFAFQYVNYQPAGLWKRWADEFAKEWGDAPAVVTLRGMAEDDPLAAIDLFAQVLDADPAYWFAAERCGQVFERLKNWHSALAFYRTAAKDKQAKKWEDLQFRIGWCSGKLRDHAGEEASYRACLKIAPDYPFARNNLGWSLMKQRRLEEAVPVFEEAIRRGNDGSYPARNLKKVQGRLKKVTKSQAPPASDDTASGRRSPLVPRTTRRESASVIEDADADAGSGAALDCGPSTGAAFTRESRLEDELHAMILAGERLFDRRLRMYTAKDGRYGRQFPIAGVGILDLLAEDVDTAELVVIELKRGATGSAAVDQCVRYVDAVRKKIAGKRMVVGIVCVNETNPKLVAASRAAGIDVRTYGIQFGRA